METYGTLFGVLTPRCPFSRDLNICVPQMEDGSWKTEQNIIALRKGVSGPRKKQIYGTNECQKPEPIFIPRGPANLECVNNYFFS